MKTKVIISFFLVLSFVVLVNAAGHNLGVQAKGEHEYMFVRGDGEKNWYSALEFEQIARDYAKRMKLDFKFDHAEKNIWVNTDGSKILAEVWFSTGFSDPALNIQIGRNGKVVEHRLEKGMRDEVLGPK